MIFRDPPSLVEAAAIVALRCPSMDRRTPRATPVISNRRLTGF